MCLVAHDHDAPITESDGGVPLIQQGSMSGNVALSLLVAHYSLLAMAQAKCSLYGSTRRTAKPERVSSQRRSSGV